MASPGFLDTSSPNEENEITADTHRMWLKTPGRSWRDGFPCGNGRTGAVLAGGVWRDRLLINAESWYFRSVNQELPDISNCLPKVRAALREGRIEEANHCYERALRERGFNPHIAIYQPGFDVVLQRPGGRIFRNYRRVLEMATGESRVEWTESGVRFFRRLFVSRETEVAVLECGASEGARIDLDVALELHDLRDAIDADGRRFVPTLSGEVRRRAATLIFTGSDSAVPSREFFGLVRVVPQGEAASMEFSAGNGAVRVRRADRVLLLIRALPEGTTRAEVDTCCDRLDELTPDYETLFAPSRATHTELFRRTRFSLEADGRERSNEALLMEAFEEASPLALVERMWDYGRYLLICSSAPGSLPSHLQGLWNGDYDPPWQCFYMANENLQMNYWQALPGAMPEVLEPVFAYYEGLLDDFRTSARRLYGCRGIYVPPTTAPDSGLPKVLHSHLLYWTAGAGWLAQHFYDYYRFTGDEEFLRDRALPFMREVAQFYEDFLFLDDTGTYCFSPSISPENCPPERERAWSEGGSWFISVNATMDVAICRELLGHLIEGAERVGFYADEIPRWRHLLGHLPPYAVNEDGAIREWLHPAFPDNYRHRHLSHLYPVFPGDEVTRECDPELFAAFAQAVEKRLVVGLDEQTGWSLAHMANIHARLGNGERAGECLELLARACVGPNLFTYHNDWRRTGLTLDLIWGESAPFQIDANMGWTAAVIEMVLFSRPGALRLLPALPKAWKRGRMQNLQARGGIAVSLAWDLDAARVEGSLRAVGETELEIGIPGAIVSEESVVSPLGFVLVDDRKVRLTLPGGGETRFTFVWQAAKSSS